MSFVIVFIVCIIIIFIHSLLFFLLENPTFSFCCEKNKQKKNVKNLKKSYWCKRMNFNGIFAYIYVFANNLMFIIWTVIVRWDVALLICCFLLCQHKKNTYKRQTNKINNLLEPVNIRLNFCKQWEKTTCGSRFCIFKSLLHITKQGEILKKPFFTKSRVNSHQ